jgi:hypothetical protein
VFTAPDNSTAAGSPAGEAQAAAALYHFLKMRIEVDCERQDVFVNGSNTLKQDGRWYPYIWHEYSHYLQNFCTTIGISITINWVAVMVQFAKAHANGNTLIVPTFKDPTNPFNAQYKSFLDQVNELIGLQVELDTNPPASAVPFSLYGEDSFAADVFLCLAEESGKKVGVPLIGDAFFEGISQATQWLAEGHVVWDDTLLQARNVADKDVYYHGLIRFFRHHFPNTNPCYPMVALGNLCLLTRSPGHFFRYVFEQHQQNGVPSAPDQWLDLRRRYGELGYVKEGVDFASARVNEFIDQQRARPVNALTPVWNAMANTMRTGIEMQRSQPELLCVFNPTGRALVDLAQTLGFPPLFTRNIDSGFGLAGHADLRSFCFLGHAAFELIDGLYRDGLIAECSFLHTRICNFRKGSHCKYDRLNLPEVDGHYCIMGAVAQSLGINGRACKKLP